MSHTSDLSGLSKQYSSRDLPSHVKLKYRESGQGAPEDIKKDKKELRKELEEREKNVKESKRSSVKDEAKEDKKAKKQKLEAITTINLDADEPIVNDDDTESNDELNDDDDDDETAELMAELERIKKERASEAAKIEAERLKQEEKVRVENILKGNPLLNTQKSDFKVKRRWDDDVVFKNCAKGDDKIVKKGFINDTLRSDFHKKFMERYIK